MRTSMSRVCSFAMSLALSLLATACGGGGDSPAAAAPVVATPAPTPAPAPTTPDATEAETATSAMTFAHVRTADALQALSNSANLKASGATLSTDLAQYTVYLNNKLLDISKIAASGDSVSFTAPLVEGRNDVLLFAPDSTGAPVEAQITFWAGTFDVAGRVVDDVGNPVAGAVVQAALGDDSRVTATTTSDNSGNYRLKNFPGRTVLVSVTGPTGLPGSSSSIAGTPFPDVVLLKFGTPVAVANNEFLAGTSGWLNLSGANVSLVSHSDVTGPLSQKSGMKTSLAATPATQDLRVGTSGQGPRTVTYTLKPPADTKTAKIRYRFQTDEFPTYYGTKYNDSFQVTLRTQGGASNAVSGAMNELGQAAFDATGSTAWKELTLELGTAGEPVQVDLTVANVGDGAVDSAVIVDFVATSPLAIPSASLFDIDNVPLKMLSSASHTYFGGSTRVNASLKVTGASTAKLSKLELQVFQSGALKATGKLTSGLESTVYKTFGTTGAIELASPQLVFEIPSAELSNIDHSGNGDLSLKISAVSDDGGTALKDVGSVQLLDLWTGTQRYGGRDEALGGDDWVQPGSRDIFSVVSVTWGDFSNMNGGPFSPHSSHQIGKDADGWYDGYNARDAAAATTMIGLINTVGAQDKVKIVYVTHEAVPGNAFYDAYKDVTLTDGRPAKSVIKNFPGHTTHFHWNAQ